MPIYVNAVPMHMSAKPILSVVSPILDFIFLQGSLKPLTFEERNIKLGRSGDHWTKTKDKGIAREQKVKT